MAVLYDNYIEWWFDFDRVYDYVDIVILEQFYFIMVTLAISQAISLIDWRRNTMKKISWIV